MKNRRTIREDYAHAIFDLTLLGYYITPEQENLLIQFGLTGETIEPRKNKSRGNKYVTRDLSIPAPEEVSSSGLVDVVVQTDRSISDAPDRTTFVVSDEDMRSITDANVTTTMSSSITKDMWVPSDLIYHDDDFVKWIDSINNDYESRLTYKKQQLYAEQSRQWLDERGNIMDFNSYSDQLDYAMREMDRCSENTLYMADKYVYLKESELSSGRMKYVATDDYDHHRILFYMADCGYSMMVGKPRQGAFTTVFGIYGVKRTLLKSNHYLKLITADLNKGKEIFTDKFKYIYSELPSWLRPAVSNDSETLLWIGKKSKKGEVSEVNSRIEVDSPTPTAINGGQPNVVIVDEIGDIDILTPMLTEGRPALFWKNPLKDNKFEMKRQLIAFGTGVYNASNTAYEREWNRMMHLWRERKFEGGIIPLFFDWKTRCNREEYEKQKEYYYGGGYGTANNLDLEASKIQFHQHFPSKPEDMFITTAKTVVSRDEIDSMLKSIRDLDPTNRPVWGYFEPIYNTSKPISEDNSDVPFEIVGANFVACDYLDDKTCVLMFMPPNKEYVDRYYQGTDPLSAESGTSKMGSAIWDKLLNTVSCIVLSRSQGDLKYSFRQCLLMGMYYNQMSGGGLKELVEKNIGAYYCDYVDGKGCRDRLLYNSELLEMFQSGDGSDLGIDNKSYRSKLIVSKLHELTITHGKKIFIPTFWEQLGTFVCKVTRNGNETWESRDKRYFSDDILFAITFAYICSESCSLRFPRKISEEGEVKKRKGSFVLDSNYNLTRVEK